MSKLDEQFQQQLISSGIPASFSTVAAHQTIPADILTEIDHFIEIFENVTTRSAWVKHVLKEAPEIACQPRSETCFFSAWDIHLPPEQPKHWQLIEFNDNGSGFLLASLLNDIYYDIFLSGQRSDNTITPPLSYSELCRQITAMLTAEASAFEISQPTGRMLILDDADSLQNGKFCAEHLLLKKIAQKQGWSIVIDSPESLHWNGKQLQLSGNSVTFIINRSTDFLWQSKAFAPLVHAYRAGCVYVAPNPYSYTTRSDKQLLEFLSRPDWDTVLGITDNERVTLSNHVPETYLINEENLNQLAEQKTDFVFKPIHGHASLGILDSHEVGKHRLNRLLNKGHHYVAQRIAEKSKLTVKGKTPLWTDLRVWAYKGKRYQISGRASATRGRLDLHEPGGWLPTFERK